MAERLNIAVVGCGIAGCAAALMLQRDGHRVTLFEQSEQVGPIGAGILLQPSGQRVVAELGLLDALRKHSAVIDEILATTHCGRELVRIRYADYRLKEPALGVHRGDLFQLLHDAICAEKIDLRLGVPVDRCEEDADSARLIESTGARHGPFDLVVAADGSRSRLRRHCRIRVFEHEYEHAAIWAVGQSSEPTDKLLQFARGCRILCGLLPMGGGRCSLFWGISQRDYAKLIKRGFAAWRDEVLALAPQTREIFDSINGFRQTRFTIFRHVWMNRWHTRRTVFIGDAAHAMSPHLGQGVNLALQDAQTLRDSVRQHDGMPSALARYDRRRRRSLSYYAAVTYLLAPFFQSDWNLLATPRDLVLPRLARFTPTRAMVLRTLVGR